LIFQQSYKNFNQQTAMFRNYLKIAWRNILKHKTFSIINVVGLAVSMSVCLLIIAIIADQKSYDQFHTKKSRIYRVRTVGQNGDDFKTATSALPLADKLKREYSGIEQTASLVRKIGGDVFFEEKIASGGGYFADGNLFKILDFQLSEGDANSALQNPFTMVISQDMATQLFGSQSAMGKSVRFNDKGINPGGPETGNRETEYGLFTITGVLKPNPGKTHLPFKLLASLSTLPALGKNNITDFKENDWNNVWTNYTYVLLDPANNEANLQTALAQIADKQYPKGSANEFGFVAEPMMALTPGEPIGNMTHISMPKVVLYILGILCLIVMLSACLNYTNLSVARSLTRAREVGVRKVAGATRQQIFTQFIAESVIISLGALVLAVGILALLKMAFKGLWLNQFLNITFENNLWLLPIFAVFSIVIGFIAGVLPSIYISAFDPIQMLRNFGSTKLFKRLTLRKVLLVIQFSVSLVFIISTSLLYFQTNHLLNFDYGFEKNNIVNIKLYKPQNYARFAQVASQNKDVSGVSACSYMPATGVSNGTTIYSTNKQKDSLQVNFLDIDSKCIDVWNLKMVAGTNLPEIPATVGEQFVLVNETMVDRFKFGSKTEAVGQKLLIDGNNVTVVGVVKDFQFLDVSRKMGSLVLRNRQDQFGFASVKISGKNTPETLAKLEKQWKEVNPMTKFEYQFLDQQLLFTHSMLKDIASVLGFLAFLAVLISCLGLLGMATYTAETRIKEIGVRKVLGATVWQIIVLLSRGFATLLLIAVVIATPLAYFANNLWLNFFASRVSISIGILFGSILSMIVISLLVVFSQSWRAAMSNPVESLKKE
jgi:putative ABC transport system permease protein